VIEANHLIRALVAASELEEHIVSTPDLSRGDFDEFASSTRVYRPNAG